MLDAVTRGLLYIHHMYTTDHRVSSSKNHYLAKYYADSDVAVNAALAYRSGNDSPFIMLTGGIGPTWAGALAVHDTCILPMCTYQ